MIHTMQQRMLTALADIHAVIFPFIDDETIATFPPALLNHYQSLDIEQRRSMIELIKLRAALERIYGALCGLDCVGGVLNDLDLEAEYGVAWYDATSRTEACLHRYREVFTELYNSRAVALSMAQIDERDYLNLPPWKGTSDSIEYGRCLKIALVEVEEHSRLNYIEEHAKHMMAINAEHLQVETPHSVTAHTAQATQDSVSAEV